MARPKTLVDRESGYVRRIHQFISTRCECGKAAYSSKKLAKQKAKMTTRAIGEPVEAYHCFVGHCWHIGHRPGWRNEQLEAS